MDESIARVLVVGFFFAVFMIVFSAMRTLWRKTIGIGRSPSILQQDEMPQNELILVARDFQFKGFTLASSRKGRLFFTNRGRILFTSPDGKKIGLEVPFDRLQEATVEMRGFLKHPELSIHYVDENGKKKSVHFDTATKVVAPLVENASDAVSLQREYNSWIEKLNTCWSKAAKG